MLTRKRAVATALGCAIAAFVAATALATNVERHDYTGERLHWNDGAGGGPGYVTLVDTTGPRWLVRDAAIDWDFAGNINVNYESGSCGGGGHCVKVYSEHFSDFTCRGRPGVARLIYPLFDNHLHADTKLRLNQDCVGGGRFTDNQRRVVVCQEMGHVLGLAHDFDAGHHNTCMAATTDNFDHPEGRDGWTGRQHDFRTLDNVLYDHRD